MTSPWDDSGDASITELDATTQRHTPANPGQPGRGGMPSPYAFAAGVMVGAVLVIAITENPTPGPEAPRASPSPTVSTPTPPPSLGPRAEPSPLPEPVHLLVGHPVSVEIDGMLVSLSVPLEFEGVYYAPRLLATGRAGAPALAITTSDQVGTGCLRLEDAVSTGGSRGSTGPTATAPKELPTTAAARGPVAFTLDGYQGYYFHFTTPAGACHPNVIWDSIVGDFGGRGPSVGLELWTLDVDGTTLVFGSYAVNNAPAEQLEELRAVAASAQIRPIRAPSASLTPDIIETGFIGLPPVGANPSAPVPAVLVEEYPVDGGGLPLRGLVRIYDDGRLIWYRFFDGPAGENSRSTGYLQQRLTSLGIAMVKAHADLAEKDPLALVEWLPPGAWDDPVVHAYVPTRFAACLPAAVSAVPGVSLVDLLPASAADLLRVKPLVSGGPSEWDCHGITIDEARVLTGHLQSAGFQQNEAPNRYVLEYAYENTEVFFEPIFPDGTIGCSGCG